jgi:phosphatidylinositol glycan class W
VTEYGVHWNFFFTLAVISIVGNSLPLQGVHAAIAAISIAGAYQCALTFTGLENYILNAPRVDLLSANREGVFGCVGYSAGTLSQK